MVNKLYFKHDINTDYFFIINNKKTNFKIKRVKILNNFYGNFIKSDYKKIINGYFMHNEKVLNSFLFKNSFDVIFVDRDNKIIFLEESFPKNKISNYWKETKFIYLLPENTINTLKISKNNLIKHSRI